MRIILCFLLALVAAPAWAEWVVVSESEDGGLAFYIDPASIRKNGHFRKVWLITDLKQRGEGGEMSRRVLDEYDCKEERSRILSISGHSGPMAGGETLEMDDGAGKWYAIAPGSMAETVFKRVCAK